MHPTSGLRTIFCMEGGKWKGRPELRWAAAKAAPRRPQPARFALSSRRCLPPLAATRDVLTPVGFSQPMIDNLNDKVAGAHSQRVTNIFGDDFNELPPLGKQSLAAPGNTPGTPHVSIDPEPPPPQI